MDDLANLPDLWDIEIRSMFHKAPQWDMVRDDIELNGKVAGVYAPRCQSDREKLQQEVDEWIAESIDMTEDRPCQFMRDKDVYGSGEALEVVPELASRLMDRKASAKAKEYRLNNPRKHHSKPLGVWVNQHHAVYNPHKDLV